MAGSIAPPLRIFTDDESIGAGTAAPSEAADQLFLAEAFRNPPKTGSPTPFSENWFARIASCRYVRYGQWLPRALEFAKHTGETVLAFGEGLGTDWIQYARHGADVSVLCSSLEQLDLIRTHFDYSGEKARFVHGPTRPLPIASDSIDVVCIQGLLQEDEQPAEVVSEVFRVLRPGGKVIAVAPARFNADYWSKAFFPWRKWFHRRTITHGPGMSARELTALFSQFTEHRVSKRHLRRAELPQIWRCWPLPVLERIIGNRLIVKAFKPLSAAATVRRAA